MEKEETQDEQTTWQLSNAIDTLKTVGGCCGVNCCCGS
jgi:hypothetical protein